MVSAVTSEFYRSPYELHYRAFLHNPDLYPDPFVFNPDRFMGPNPQRDPKEFAFGYGRRLVIFA